MKAFQLKIMIKNSKPPIWRRVIVPTGITFSQLSIILNKVMGWCGYHQFEFEFSHLELCLMENVEELAFGFAPYDYQDASTTYIGEYLEENDWFTYTYDLGDNWEHRVTVEKVITDYAWNYPMVLKYKGNCPVEDCGGIYGYYEFLEIIRDETHPEHEDRLAWMEMQGYPNEYDLTLINEELEDELFYLWGKGENRTQNEIYEELFDGNYGLRATTNDKKKKGAVRKSTMHKMQDAMNAIVNMRREEEAQKERLGKCTLADVFADYTKDDIREIAKEKGLRGISGCNKDQLIEKLVGHMLQPEVLRSYFLCLQDRELEEFEKASGEKLYDSDQGEYLQNLYSAAYIGMLPDGRIGIPRDVLRMYRQIVDEEFHTRRQEISFVLACLRTAGMLYGIAPVELLLRMVNQHSELNLAAEELQQDIESIPPEFSVFVIMNDRVYHKRFYPDDRGLLGAQGNKEYYLPTVDEISDMGIYGYFPNHPETVRFRQYLIDELDADQEDAELVVEMIQRTICGDCQMGDILEILDDFDLTGDTDKTFRGLMKRVDALWNDTRMLLNRGYTPN